MPSGSEWSTYTAESNEPIDQEPIDLTLPRISGIEWPTYSATSNEPIDQEPIDLTLPRISGSDSSTFLNGNESMGEISMADGPLQSTFIEQSKHIYKLQQKFDFTISFVLDAIATFEECSSQIKAVQDFCLLKGFQSPNHKTLAELSMLIQLQQQNLMSNTEGTLHNCYNIVCF